MTNANAGKGIPSSTIASLSSGQGKATYTPHQTFPGYLTTSGTYAVGHEPKALGSLASARTFIPMAGASFMAASVPVLKQSKGNKSHRGMAPRKGEALEMMALVGGAYRGIQYNTGERYHVLDSISRQRR
jgi:hypothetical protein